MILVVFGIVFLNVFLIKVLVFVFMVFVELFNINILGFLRRVFVIYNFCFCFLDMLFLFCLM